MTRPEYWIGAAAQGGFSSLTLPAAGRCGRGIVIYSNGSSTPVIARGDGLTAVLMNTSVDLNFLWASEGPGLASAGSGGPFNEPYFDTAAGGFDVYGSPLAFGTGDYTVECWFRCASRDNTTDLPRVNLWGNNRSSSTVYFQTYCNPYRVTGYPISPPMISSGENTPSSLYEDLKPSARDQWRHFAVCRASGTTSKWENGSLISTDRGTGFGGRPLADYGSGANAFYSVGGRMHIGQTRIFPGEAVYSGSTIAVPAAPFI
jgi:hypothetical protein